MIPEAVQHTSPAIRRERFGLGSPVTLAVLLSVLVGLLRLLLSRQLTFCGTPDACYYLGMAQNLGSGQGFHARFVYDFQQAHLSLPNTGIEYWRPGISLLLLLLKPFGGVALHSSIALTTLIGVLFSAAAWHIAAQTYRDRRIALGAFALCLLSSPVWVGSATPDSGLYYGAAVAWFLAFFTVRRQGLWQDLLALLCVCLAYFIRNDAALLFVPLLAVLWARRRLARRSDSVARDFARGQSTGYVLWTVLGFFIALAPMHLLYRAVLGTAFPSGTAQVLFLNDLTDFGRYHDPVSLRTLLGHGLIHLAVFRVATFATVLYRVGALMIGYPALVFLPALFLRTTRPGMHSASPSTTQAGTADARIGSLPELAGPLSFALVAVLAYTVVLPAIGGFSALRTAVGLMPLISVLVLVAILRAARTPRIAVLLTAAVITANAISGLMEARRDLPVANQIGAADREEAQILATLHGNPSTAVVLTNDPVQFSVTTGYATIALPSNGLDAIVQAAHDFHATHVILDSDNLPATPAVLARQLQPVRSVSLPREHSLILELPRARVVP